MAAPFCGHRFACRRRPVRDADQPDQGVVVAVFSSRIAGRNGPDGACLVGDRGRPRLGQSRILAGSRPGTRFAADRRASRRRETDRSPGGCAGQAGRLAGARKSTQSGICRDAEPDGRRRSGPPTHTRFRRARHGRAPRALHESERRREGQAHGGLASVPLGGRGRARSG